MTRVFVLTNHKGGVGKSTTATNLAYGLVQAFKLQHRQNSRVLLIDTDSQSHSTLVTTGRSDFGKDDSLYTVVMAERQEAFGLMTKCIVQSEWDPDLHVIPASALLEGAERELLSVHGAPFRISQPLGRVASNYGAVVIDTRPSFSLVTEMALLAATHAIIPVEPRYLETVGLSAVLHKLQAVRDGWDVEHLSISGILITKFDKRVRGHNELLEAFKTHPQLGKHICGVIPDSESVPYSHSNHLSVMDFDPKSPASTAYGEFILRTAKQMGVGGSAR